MAIAAKKHKIDIDRANEKLKYLADVELFPLDTDVKLIPAFLHLFRKKSYNISRFYSKSFAKKISEKLSANNFDAVQFETIFMAPYLSIVKEKTSAPCILRQHNMESEIWERRANREVNPLKKWYVKHLTKRLRDYEKKMLPKFDSIVWVTEHDLQKGKNESGHTPNFVVPSGVEIPIESSELKTNKNKWYHLGALDWPPNLEALMWFLKSVWPKMIEENRELELHIAGRNCPNFLKKYKAKGVYVYGEIPNGMGAIPKQLYKNIGTNYFHFFKSLEKIENENLFFEDGYKTSADFIIDTRPKTFQKKANQNSLFVFITPNKVLKACELAVFENNPLGISNLVQFSNLYVNSRDVEYIGISVNNKVSESNKLDSKKILEYITNYFDTTDWKWIKTHHIPYGLNNQEQVNYSYKKEIIAQKEKTYLAGDWNLYGSTNAAIHSGKCAAEAIIRRVNTNI